MRIVVPREHAPGERRVAMSPSAISRLASDDLKFVVESGAGLPASHSDDEYREAGAEVVSDPKKGDFYVARINKPGRPASQIIAKVVPEIAAKFPWPKSMRWGSGDFQWVRPLHSVLCLYDGTVVPFELAGLSSGNSTCGHRFHGRDPFAVEDFEEA